MSMGMSVELWRDRHGVPHIQAGTEADLYWGQGVVHATDRGMQMLLMRILVQGRVSEVLTSDEQALDVDTFFRRMNWTQNTKLEVGKLRDEASEFLHRYCDGVNSVLEKKVPWEFRLFGYRPEPWTPEDTLAIIRMIGYVTLQQSQAEMERLLVEMVQAGVAEERLEELFPGILGGLDIDLLKKVSLGTRMVPTSIPWNVGAFRMMASNNWVLAGAKTASGKPILCNDPHLEGNRLPNVWHEVAMHIGNRYALGGAMPGGPGILIGRTPDVAWGATYSFADALDSWIEQCNEGKYFREPDQWLPFQPRREVIRRRRKDPVEVVFHENEHGVLDGDPRKEGYYLATRWAAAQSGAKTITQVFRMWRVTTVEEAMQVLGQVESAWNFVFADRHGNIGYQMSGLVPKRRAGVAGFAPLPGWKKENDWAGFESHEQLPRVLNPEDGCFVTANHDLNGYGKAKPINMPMGSYRADRIGRLLRQGDAFSTDDMTRMQFDLFSTQAATFMDVLLPLLPDTPQAEILKKWDLRYTAESEGAFLFEEFYQGLCREVFGNSGMGEEVVDHLMKKTGVFIDFYQNFDRILLAEHSCWTAGTTRDELYRRVAAKTLATRPQPWGKNRKYMLRHLLFGGKLARLIGFDRGPVTAIGSRATVHQGQIYRSGGRVTTFVPSFRLVTDLADDCLLSNLAGGPSDRRFSKWYCSDLRNWLTGKYKRISASLTQEKLPL